MNKLIKTALNSASAGALILGLAVTTACAQEASVPIVQPGAPGQSGKSLSASEASQIADTAYSDDDVSFMQNMIPHHAQAVELANLVDGRTNTPDLLEISGRIKASQADEIEFMQGWLKERGETAPKVDGGHAGHAGHGGGHVMTEEMMLMMGMASQAQITELSEAEGVDFDSLFYTLMIRHHEGAVNMVNDLHSQPGSAYDPVLFDFTNDIVNDQTAEIKRMNGLLAGLSPDARVGLKAGFRDAGEAAMNMKLISALPKPTGFFDPKNPRGLPPIIEPDEKDGAERGNDETANEGTEWGERSPLLSFSNTDMAFFGDKMIAGNYHGFNTYSLADGGIPKLLSSVVCPGGQGDVSVVGDLLIMSVEQTRGRVDCGRQGISEDISAERFRGIRIFDISDLTAPRQVGQVQTCRGSHTHSIVSGPGRDGKIIVYNSGTSSVRDEEELAGCIGGIPGDDRTALFRIDVIEIPVADPSKARIVDSPAVFADEETGNLAGLWTGGDHGADTQTSRQTNQCHDITVFPEAKIAAGACSGNGIIFDISNPREPKRIDAVVDKGFAYWHSATFNNDGTKVLFTDEWGGGGRPRCQASDPQDWGADAIYDIIDGKLKFRSYYKLPAPQSDKENCVAHNGAVVPVPGRDIFVQAWYQGGISIMDFTDSANPIEIAYFDRGPLHDERIVLGGYWSTYWYDGKIYGTEISRGLDILELVPSEYLSANEIEAAKLADQGAVFNPQQQFPVSWPAEPVIAMAYIDQLVRSGTVSDDMVTSMVSSLGGAETALESGTKNGALASELSRLARSLGSSDTEAALGSSLRAIAARLN